MRKNIGTIIISAIVFGCVAGASMVGVNALAYKTGINANHINSEVATNDNLGEDTEKNIASDENPKEIKENTSKPIQNVGDTNSVADIAKESMPSVVAITNMMKFEQNGYSMWGSVVPRQYEVPASGSGIIVDKTDTELLIVTNNHVVTDSNSLSVNFMSDDEPIKAAIKGTDSKADLAVIAVELKDIPKDTLDKIKVAKLGDSDSVQVGDRVVAIGNALGYGQSVTTGIISAKDRSVNTNDGGEAGLLQTDAAINPGNSGGALLDMNGDVIGINVAKYASTEVEGMGYSIPSSKARDIINNLSSLTTREEVPENERGCLGIQAKDVDSRTAEMFDLPKGVFVYKKIDGSTANNAELKDKDIIVSIDGQSIGSLNDLASVLGRYRAGENVVLTVKRKIDGKYEDVKCNVILGAISDISNGAKADNFGNGNLPRQNNNDDDMIRQFQDFFDNYMK